MPTLQQRRLLLDQQAIQYLRLGRFSATIAAPLPSPLPLDVGTLTTVDTNSRMSQSGGGLVIAAAATGATDGLITPAKLVRASGRAFLIACTALPASVATTMRLGFSTFDLTSASIDYGIDFGNAPTNFRIKSGVAVIEGNAALSGVAPEEFAFVLRGTGAFLLGRSARSGPYTLFWVYNAGTADEYAKLVLNTNSIGVTFDDWRELDLGGQFATDDGLAQIVVAATSNGLAVAASSADVFVEHTITAATGVSQELSVRRTTDTDCWIVRMDQTGSTIKLIEIVASVETERASAAQTWTNATQYRVVATCDGATIKTYVENVAKNSYASASSNQTATGVKVSHAGANLKVFPRLVSLGAV